ncbi:MAG: TonB-dependent receptor [Xanthomonadaceae bacterium]|jgi:iron complex outermembrane receptor protein|nr:TonB-dependent receptor [Xanthomonadaceae bacterium]
MSQSLLRHSILAAIYGGTAIGAVSAPAMAQDQDAEQLDTITVIGSRIKRTDIETSQPVFVLERQDLQRTGLTSVGDILQDLSTNGATLNTTFNNGGNGETRINLRNLGSNRTLVLVNGRRWVSGLGGQVDLNTIPVSVIERVEVLKDGASAIYGSDAIAGVINITTRDNYDGMEASAYLGENEEGDGRTELYDFTIGSSTDRASAVLNVSYAKQDAIFAGDREISSVPRVGFDANNVFAGASSTTPFGIFQRAGTGQPLLTLIPGRPGTTAADFRPFSNATDGFNFAPDNYLLTPQERTGIYAQARYNITDSVSFRTSLVYNERRSELLLAAIPFVFGTVGSGLARFNVSANNVFNPFGADIVRAQYRNTAALRSFGQDVDTFYFSGGFDGAFDLFDRSFTWDVNYIYTDNERNDLNTGQFDLNRLALGLGPSFRDTAGVARCGTPTAVIAGCVPINIFGGPSGFTQAMVDYASFTEQSTIYKELHNYSANLTGDLFELPAGPLGFAAGYEYRRESGFDQPDALTASGASTGNIRQPTRGGFALDEFYVEFNVPVLKDLAFAEVLEFSVAARYSDYSNFGDTTNPKFGFRWKPFADLLVRGNYADGFRAPSISELFTGNSDSFPNLADPCSANNIGAQNAQTVANCRNGIGGLPGVPTGYQQANQQIRITQGGNAALNPELARTKTLGLVYSPSFVEGLDLYLDWYNIEITDSIGLFSGQFIVNDCYQTGNISSCALIRRAADGTVTDVRATTQNLPGGTEVEGYDFTVDYRFDTDFGKFRINWDTAYRSYLGTIGQPAFNTCRALGRPVNPGEACPGGIFDSGNQTGLLFDRNPNWRIRSNISTNWQMGDWGATLSARYYSALDENCAIVRTSANSIGQPGLVNELCSNPGPNGSAQFPIAENQLDDTWYFDLQGTWDAPWNGRVTAGIRNLFDEDPPVSFAQFANSFDPQYEIPGRFWYVQYSQKF